MSVQIGSKFTGKYQGFADTTNGVYWEVLPKIEGDAGRIQRGLLKPRVSRPKAASRYAKIFGNNAKN
jgi:hypothetical protein